MNIFAIIVLIPFCGLIINAGFILRYRIFTGGWPTNKVLIISNVILIVISIFIFLLPRSDGNCKVNIIINNENSSSEIIINREYNYQLYENKKIILNDLKSYGTIAIKTENDALITTYYDDNHLFKLIHKINILVLNNEIINVEVFPKLLLGKITDDIKIYDKVIHLFK
jgi:hypothetical protein